MSDFVNTPRPNTACYNTLMLAVAFLQWWYGPGWGDASRRLAHRIDETYLWFSVPILLRTMFQPWRRITTPPGTSLEQKLRALVDNLVSRAVGFTVRLLALLVATILISFYGIIGGALLVLWPLIPLLGPALIVAGVL
jgi:hypothetical protein